MLMCERLLRGVLGGAARARLRWGVCVLCGLCLWAQALGGCAGVDRRGAQGVGAEARVVRYALHEAPWGWRVEAQVPAMRKGAKVCAPALGQRGGEALRWVAPPLDAFTWDDAGCTALPDALAEQPWLAVYEVEVREAPQARWLSRLDPWRGARGGLVVAGESLFLAFPEREGMGAVVALEGPSEVLTTWSAARPHPREVRLEGQRDLLRSAVWRLGPEQGVWRGEMGGVVWVGPRGWEWGEALAEAAALVDWLDAHWVPGRARDDAPLQVWILEILEADVPAPKADWAGDGLARRGGVLLRVPSGWLERPQATWRRWLLAHELFHRDNGESLYFSDADGLAARWFTEGMTSYVAAQVLVQLGWLDRAGEEALLSALAAPSSDDAYTDGVARSRALDQTIRARSEGKRSVQGFWVFLSGMPALWDRPLSAAEVSRWLASYGGVSAF
jgi:hypothetical protein